MRVLKLFSIVILLTLVINSKSNAQKSVILQHLGDVSGYNSISEALLASVDGDTLYISGGIFTEDLAISKSLVIYGAGHYPDSTSATGKSQINGNLTISGSAGSGSVEGVYIGNITFNGTFSNYSIIRSNTGYIRFQTGPIENILISENVIRDYIDFNNVVDNILIEKNIINKHIVNFNKSALLINNNIFPGTPGVGTRTFYSVYGAVIRNNILLLSSDMLTNTSVSDNAYNNNIIVYNYTTLDPSNLTGVDPASIFVNQSGTAFDYSNDYHLSGGSPAINFGTDGTDAGIYGTVSPCKLSAVPSNPHISVADVANETDASGKLKIRFVVIGQSY